jgi:cytoskeletal protein RodZ
MVGESKSLGEIFREEREKKGLDLKKISSLLKVSYRYLEALENDTFDKINLSDFYKKAIIKKYANILGLNESNIIDLYYSQYEKKEDKIGIPFQSNDGSRCGWKYGIYILVVVILLITIFTSLKFQSRPITQKEPTYTLYSLSNQEESSYTYSLGSSNYTTTETIFSQNENTQSPTIKVVANDRTWIRVSNNEKIIYEGILKKGDTLTWTYTSLYFHIGNAGGIEIFYNDQSIGVLGKRGEVIKVKVP